MQRSGFLRYGWFYKLRIDAFVVSHPFGRKKPKGWGTELRAWSARGLGRWNSRNLIALPEYDLQVSAPMLAEGDQLPIDLRGKIAQDGLVGGVDAQSGSGEQQPGGG